MVKGRGGGTEVMVAACRAVVMPSSFCYAVFVMLVMKKRSYFLKKIINKLHGSSVLNREDFYHSVKKWGQVASR
jgi:hypothetical protein